MIFSTKAEYGVRVMAHLAGTDAARPVSLGSIAEAGGTSARLPGAPGAAAARQGLVESRRGAHGGYTLSRPAGEITMAEIVSALEGHLAPIECITPEGMCSREVKGDAPCPTKLLWTRVQGSIVRTLTDMTLEDFSHRRRSSGRMSLEIQNLHVRTEEREILHGVDLDDQQGRDPRADGPERLGQVDARQHADGQPDLRDHRGQDHARR